MAKNLASHTLSRRERQILDVLYRAGRATAADIQQSIPDAPSYSAVRALLRILEEKGHVRHQQDGPRYLYVPTVARDRAQRSALRHLVNTFFQGSAAQTIAALIDEDTGQLTKTDWQQLRDLIDRAAEKGH